ncbi:MAG TPA: DNA polymerase III subunit delta' [Candidatus Avamphibacillus intestinigallinarum]|nr:DNA polymerase III subunit delta' [Candidatus Avamphibacillus intestinigallinarum]
MNTWEEVAKVQPVVAHIIQNSINKSRVSHAYLIQGARGTGKKAIATLFAKALFCEQPNGPNPCLTCNACQRIESGNHPDVHMIKPDGQSIKIEQIRQLQKEFTYSGMESNQKIYIIEGAETLTVNAANRILKFLEEPSRATTAMMLTENGQAMLPTIRSRCQLLDLQPLPRAMFEQQLLEEGIQASLARIISSLTNNVDEALELSKSEAFAQARKLVLQLIGILATNPDDAYLFIHQHWFTHFKERTDIEQGLDLLLRVFSDILYHHIGDDERMVMLTKTDERLQEAALRFSKEALLSNVQAVMRAKREVKQNIQPTLIMEKLVLQVKR